MPVVEPCAEYGTLFNQAAHRQQFRDSMSPGAKQDISTMKVTAAGICHVAASQAPCQNLHLTTEIGVPVAITDGRILRTAHGMHARKCTCHCLLVTSNMPSCTSSSEQNELQCVSPSQQSKHECRSQQR